MKNKLNKVEISFWEGTGKCKPSNCIFRLTYVVGNEVTYFEGRPPQVREQLKSLSKKYKINFPKIPWNRIVGDDDNGGELCRWENK